MKYQAGREGLFMPYEPPKPPPAPEYRLHDDWLIEFQREGKTVWVSLGRMFGPHPEETDHIPASQGLTLWSALEYVRKHQLTEFKLCQISREVKT